jgi:threonyl-tRNA synthetase
MNGKIRTGQMQKIPYMLVIGDREVEENAVSVRLRTNDNLGALTVDAFVARVKALVEARNNTDL